MAHLPAQSRAGGRRHELCSVVPTIGFDLLYAFIIIRLDRRDLVWFNVTTNPTAEWIARQITEHSLGMRLRFTLSAIGIASMAPQSQADCEQWASETSL